MPTPQAAICHTATPSFSSVSALTSRLKLMPAASASAPPNQNDISSRALRCPWAFQSESSTHQAPKAKKSSRLTTAQNRSRAAAAVLGGVDSSGMIQSSAAAMASCSISVVGKWVW
ncbi:MAG: hypothetical protein BWY59_01368 [Verrucomicrobia bacterium ADurb.Bin345]|nr:MAG: hypothetical protein BWY59_01368 [Verrucomicrobia bacterium ADurb.Bin345]